MRIQLKNQLGTTDEISASFAKKVIESGIYRKDDWVSVDGGSWKSCSEIKELDFEEKHPKFGLVPGMCRVVYDDKIFKSFWKIYNGKEKQVYQMVGSNECLSVFSCSQITTTGVVNYFISLFKNKVFIKVYSMNQISIIRTISSSAEVSSGPLIQNMNETIDNYDCGPQFSITENRFRFSLEDLQKRICSPSHDNSIDISANVRFEDETPGLMDFKIPSILINRLGKYLFVGDQYDEEFILNNNNEVLFIAETEEKINYVPSNMPFKDVEDENDVQEANGQGCVYILTNGSFPDLVKIGRTGGSVSARLNQLNSTGIPTPFECHYAAYVSDMHSVEKHLHEHFSDYRVNEKREFFKVSPKEVHKILSRFTIGDATFS